MAPTEEPIISVAAAAAAPAAQRRRSKLLTTEPALLAYMTTIVLHNTLAQQMLFQKYCALQYGPIQAPLVCSNATLTDADDALQGDTSRMRFYGSAVSVLPSIVVCAYLGAVGDRHNRKYPTVVPLLGATVGYALCALQCYFADLDPRYSLLSSFVLGVSGYFTASLQTCYSYLTTAVPLETRTLRIAIAESTVIVATVTGSFGVGPLVSAVGLTGAYALMSAVNLLGAIYCLVWLDVAAAPPSSLQAIALSRGGLRVIESFRDSMRFVLKRRRHHTSAYIRATLAAFLLCFCSSDGVSDVLYLFLTKVHGFNTSFYGYYTGADYGCKLVLGSIVLAIARRWLGADDLTLVLVGCFSGAISFAFLGAVSTDWLWMIWFSPAIGSLQLFYGVGARSFLSKSVSDGEQARLFALVSSSQSLINFVAALLFNNVYPATLSYYPGFCFALASLLSIVAMATVAYVMNHRRRARVACDEDVVDDEDERSDCGKIEDHDSKTLSVNGNREGADSTAYH